MTTISAPVKTPLGQDELRHRTRGLGQRYRTVLLLVDGRRPLGEVLGMAHKAGAQTSHFEELVRMGLVEIPDDMAAPEPTETIPGALDTPKLTSVELDVLIEPALTPSGALADEFDDVAPAPAAAPTPAAAQIDNDGFGDEPLTQVTEVKISPAHDLPVIAVASIPEPSPPPVAAPRAAVLPRYQEPEVVLSVTPRAPDWVQQVRETPFKVADHARPAPSMTDEQRLQYVRDLLLDTLRRDSILFATFSVGRVRVATTHKELIKLVWEIERDRAHTRRSRDQLLNLQRARELLGMGNTLVAGDSQPGMPSEF